MKSKLLSKIILMLFSVTILTGCSLLEKDEKPEDVFISEQIQGVQDYKPGTLAFGSQKIDIVSSLSEIKYEGFERFLFVHLYSEQKTCSNFDSSQPSITIKIQENTSSPNTFTSQSGNILFKNISSIVNKTFAYNLPDNQTQLTVKTLIPPEKEDVIEVDLKTNKEIPQQFVSSNSSAIAMKAEIKLGSTLCAVQN